MDANRSYTSNSMSYTVKPLCRTYTNLTNLLKCIEIYTNLTGLFDCGFRLPASVSRASD